VSLGPRHAHVVRLRSLVRDPKARAAERVTVLEGPRVIEGALDRGVTLESAYFSVGSDRAFAALHDRLRSAGVVVEMLKEGVLEKVGSTVTPQPVLVVAPVTTVTLDALPGAGCVLVAVGLSDPGNAGALLRSAEASGVAGVVFCGNSVDVRSPKVARASAGALFGTRVLEEDDPVQMLETLGAAGRRRLGAVARGGDAPETLDLAGAVAVVLGNEARGLDEHVLGHVDGRISIPMAGAAESLNVAIAGSVVCFEAARQRRSAGAR
jgi:RNA methyltransferase, TrmH family